MVTRLYVDNYKAFSNFEYRPAANELLLGRNGTGKSSAFEVLGMLRGLIVEGASVVDLLGASTLTRWDSRDTQRFELDIAGNGGEYRYELSVEYTPDRDKWRIGEEALEFREGESREWRPLFRRTRDQAHLYRDDHSVGPDLLLDWTRSGLWLVQPGKDNQKLTWFKGRVARVDCVRIDPRRMLSTTEGEDSAPAEDLSNYASWYRHLLQEDQSASRLLAQHLEEVIDGFEALNLKGLVGSTRLLLADLRSSGAGVYTYSMPELSDGQRALIGLYTIAAVLGRVAASGQTSMTVCIDEPENYVALAELQPWMHEIEDIADGENAQVLIASHHPEFINHYAHTNATLFYREGGGPVRIKPFTAQSDRGIAPAEVVARGWEDE